MLLSDYNFRIYRIHKILTLNVLNDHFIPNNIYLTQVTQHNIRTLKHFSYNHLIPKVIFVHYLFLFVFQIRLK